LVVFAILYGAANGVMTIVRGLAIPEMVSPHAYGTLNGIIAVPTAVAKAMAPVTMAWVWGLSSSYTPVLWTVLGVSTLFAATFVLAATLSKRAVP
jgi:hypothetical protein